MKNSDRPAFSQLPNLSEQRAGAGGRILPNLAFEEQHLLPPKDDERGAVCLRCIFDHHRDAPASCFSDNPAPHAARGPAGVFGFSCCLSRCRPPPCGTESWKEPITQWSLRQLTTLRQAHSSRDPPNRIEAPRHGPAGRFHDEGLFPMSPPEMERLAAPRLRAPTREFRIPPRPPALFHSESA